MTELNKPIRRVTSARRHEKSKTRRVILSLEPSAEVGVRLEGTRQCYRLHAEQVYELAVRWHEKRIEQRARQLVKVESVSMKRARNRARQELRSILRIA